MSNLVQSSSILFLQSLNFHRFYQHEIFLKNVSCKNSIFHGILFAKSELNIRIIHFVKNKEEWDCLNWGWTVTGPSLHHIYTPCNHQIFCPKETLYIFQKRKKRLLQRTRQKAMRFGCNVMECYLMALL